jgi:hypothetical protein
VGGTILVAETSLIGLVDATVEFFGFGVRSRSRRRSATSSPTP